MATGRQVIQGCESSFIEAANEPRDGFQSFPTSHFRRIRQGFSSFDAEQSNCSLMAALTFTGSMTDACELAAVSVSKRSEGVDNGVGTTDCSWTILSQVICYDFLF